jgi:hypothetical protein
MVFHEPDGAIWASVLAFGAKKALAQVEGETVSAGDGSSRTRFRATVAFFAGFRIKFGVATKQIRKLGSAFRIGDGSVSLVNACQNSFYHDTKSSKY